MEWALALLHALGGVTVVVLPLEAAALSLEEVSWSGFVFLWPLDTAWTK